MEKILFFKRSSIQLYLKLIEDKNKNNSKYKNKDKNKDKNNSIYNNNRINILIFSLNNLVLLTTKSINLLTLNLEL